MRRLFILLLLAACSGALVSAQPLPQDVYVWQRSWTDQVKQAVIEHGTNFTTIVALGAEITWKGNAPQIHRAAIDYGALRRCGRPVGIALRVGPFPGPFRSNDAVARTIIGASTTLVREASSNSLALAEFQIDFDAAESKLDGYATWVDAIRAKITPVPLVITALPSWLRQRSFSNLVARTDGYVLQVHSLERPKHFDLPFTLCDPEAAKLAVTKAGELRVPFRVALPTYGYFVGFDASGKFIGLAADGPSIKWPAGSRIKQVSADPAAIAGLVQYWSTNRPSALRGLIWYRLSISSDVLNWRFSTLSVVMARRVPQADLKVESRSSEPELQEILLRNAGSADFPGDISVRVRIRSGHVIASDALGGFHLEKTGSDTWTFRSPQPFLRAGDERKIGWLRTSRNTEVELEMQNHVRP